MNVRIYHNPDCSKSRKTLELLQQRGLEPEVCLYLEQPPSPEQLDRLCQGLNLSPGQLARRKESRFQELGLASKSNALSPGEWLQILHDNPVLIERPIVVNGPRVALGRPPEAVLAIL